MINKGTAGVVSSPESDDIQWFDRWAGSYERCAAQFFIDHLQRSCLDLVGEFSDESNLGVIADIGCGTGRLLRRARKRWPSANLVGVDPSRGMLDVACRLMPSGAFCAGPAESLPLPDQAVDTVFSTLSIHHWQEVEKGLQEIVRILHPGGFFCLADIQIPAMLSKWITHFEGNDPDRWKALFVQSGLTVLALKYRLAGFGLVMLGMKRHGPKNLMD